MNYFTLQNIYRINILIVVQNTCKVYSNYYCIISSHNFFPITSSPNPYKDTSRNLSNAHLFYLKQWTYICCNFGRASPPPVQYSSFSRSFRKILTE